MAAGLTSDQSNRGSKGAAERKPPTAPSAGSLMADQRLLRAIPITLVLLCVAVALVLISLAYWRRGTVMLAAAMLLGGVLRMVLSDRTIGVLAVRGKAFDVLFYVITGAFLVAVGVGIG